METPAKLDIQRPILSSPSTPQPDSASLRLWRPQAQRTLRNQWMRLAACRHQWEAASTGGRSEATSLVNAYLSQLHMRKMKLGVLSDFPHIQEKALRKLFRQQELLRDKLDLTYRALVSIVLEMIDIRNNLRHPSQGKYDSSISQFSNCLDVKDDTGDFDGVPVYQHWNISQFKHLADEFIQMFKWELNMKRRLIVELLSFSSNKEKEAHSVPGSEELYPGEIEDLSCCDINLDEMNEARLSNCQSSNLKPIRVDPELASKVLEVYLTAWISEVYLDADRLDEIVYHVGLEMQVTIK